MIISINEFKLYLEKSVKKSDRIDIYRDNNYIVVRPLTHEASCKYGAFTSWCISVPGEDYIWDESQHRNGGVIFIIQKNYQISKNKQLLINKLIDLNVEHQYNGLKGDKLHEYQELLYNDEALDLSKIAIVYANNRVQSIWDKNNIDVSDVYNRYLYNMPLDTKISNVIYDYIND